MGMHSTVIHSGAAASSESETAMSANSNDMISTVSPLPVYTPRAARTISIGPNISYTSQCGQSDGSYELTTITEPPLTPEVQYPHSGSRPSASRSDHEYASCCSLWLHRLPDDAISFLFSTAIDWITLASVGGLGIALTWFSYPVVDRVFPLLSENGTLFRVDIAYPCLDPIFSPAAAGALAALVPIATFLLCQVYYHSFYDFAFATLGLGYSLTTGTLVQLILKKHVGGLRPHFLDVCQPKIPGPGEPLQGVGFNHMMYNASICSTGLTWKVRNAMESFPSGHAAIAFAGFGYLAIYLFAHLRISRRNLHTVDECQEKETASQHSDADVREWLESREEFGFFKYARMVAVVAPLTFATYLSATLVLGYQHHAHDVIAGGLIGMGTAVLGYRTAFQGVLDWPWNCMPVTRLPTPRKHEGQEARVVRGESF